MRKTRIIATLGPACSEPSTMRDCIEAGADGFRINFSHGEPSDRADLLANARAAIEKTDREIPVIQDLTGPRLRTGPVSGSPVELDEDAEIEVRTGDQPSTENAIYTPFEPLFDTVEEGERILIDEGFLQLKVIEKTSDTLRCRIQRGGLLGAHQGINLPDSRISAPSLTEKDRKDLEMGREFEVDLIMQSFVRRPEDVIALQEEVSDWDSMPQLIAKIETRTVLDHLAEVARKVDMFLVARGDLGAEMSLAELPGLQKRVIQVAHRHDVGVITATQMLESMIDRPLPTRAEVSDISNAILDGTGSVMLSGETAIGSYPVEAVRQMSVIAKKTDEDLFPYDSSRFQIMPGWKPFIRASVRGGTKIADDVNADAIGVFTRTGLTACLVSQLRPRANILAYSDQEHIRRCLNVRWGVRPVEISYRDDIENLMSRAIEMGEKAGVLSGGDIVVFIAGTRKVTGAENLVTIRRVH